MHRMPIACAAALVLLALPAAEWPRVAQAQEQIAEPAASSAGVPRPASKPARSREVPIRVEISRADCLRLVRHEPAPDVAYEPGVDVDGDPVAPADLYGGVTIALPETVTIPIEVDLFDRFGLPPDQRYEGDVQVGIVAVELDDGRATFDGQPLTPPEQRYLAVRCQEILRGTPAE